MKEEKFYRVFDPRINQYLKGKWFRIEDIPDQVPDSFDNFVSLSNLRVILFHNNKPQWPDDLENL